MSELFSKIGGLLSLSNLDSQTDPEEIQKLLKSYRVAEVNIQEILKSTKKLQLTNGKFVEKVKLLSDTFKNVSDQQEETSATGPCLKQVSGILDEFVNYKVELSQAVEVDFREAISNFIKKKSLKNLRTLKKKYDDSKLKLLAAQKKVNSNENKQTIDAVKLYQAQIKLFEAEEVYELNFGEYTMKLQELESNCFLFLKPLISYVILHANYFRESKNMLNSWRSFFEEMINISNELSKQLTPGVDDESSYNSNNP